MEAKELRLGNYAEDQHGNLLVVDGIDTENVIYKVVDRSKFPLPDGWQATPIAITEEWLVKLGFEEFYRSSFRVKYDSPISSIGYDFNLNMEPTMSGFRLYGRWFPEIDYVHQLQNLFFALTREELILNPCKK